MSGRLHARALVAYLGDVALAARIPLGGVKLGIRFRPSVPERGRHAELASEGCSDAVVIASA